MEETERHYKKAINKPWVVEVSVTWPPDSQLWPGHTMAFKHRYATEKSALQGAPKHFASWDRFKNVTVKTRIYKK